MNQKVLEDIGMTKGEITVYLTLLKIGETTTGKIIEEAQISSGKIYEILERLIKKGLVSFIVKEKTKYFSAASPNRILDYLGEKEKELQKKEEELKREIPLLEKLRAEKNLHETKMLRGLKGIQTAIFEALDELEEGEVVLAMGVRSTKDEKYNILWEKWHRERIKRKVECRMLFSDKGSEYYRLFSKMKNTSVRSVEGLTPSAIDVLGKRVLIFTYGGEPSCLSIRDEEISRSFKTLFETLWNVGKK